jgi:hypothetical protein
VLTALTLTWRPGVHDRNDVPPSALGEPLPDQPTPVKARAARDRRTGLAALKRASGYARHWVKRKNGRFWRAQFCTEVARRIKTANSYVIEIAI